MSDSGALTVRGFTVAARELSQCGYTRRWMGLYAGSMEKIMSKRHFEHRPRSKITKPSRAPL